MNCVYFILGGYLMGSIPFGFLMGKLNGVDIRTLGSCNIGATNVTRTLGKKWGWPCFLLDAAKGFFPAYITQMMFCTHCNSIPIELPIYVALASFLGHVYPVWLNFKGGKGVATIIGALSALSWISVVVGLFVWLLSFFVSRYVSLASILMMITLPIVYYFYGVADRNDPASRGAFYTTLALFVFLGLVSLFKHRSNINRIVHGTEYKFKSHKGGV